MNRSTFYALALLAAASPWKSMAQETPTAQMERLNRGLVVVPSTQGNGKFFISWRLLGTDNDQTTFDVLRDGKAIKQDLDEKTNYVDNYGTAGSLYQIVTKQNGVPTDTTEAVKPWAHIYKKIQLERPAPSTMPDGSTCTYTPNDCSVGDVDGDGEYEIIVKWDPSNSKDNSQSGYTGNVYLDCYKLDGTKLWRIDLGRNIRAGAHYTQFLVYDFDKDGRAELICKTAPGSIDGTGQYVNQAATDSEIKTADNTTDWRNSSGKIKGGQEYLTVFNGLTGRAIHTVFYNPNRATGYGGAPEWTFNWDDRSGKTDKEYGNRGERYLATVAYLDGPNERPSAVMTRGYYTYAFLWAVDFDGKELKTKWLHSSTSKTKYSVTDANGTKTEYTAAKATSGSGSNTAYGNGNHNLSCADVDGDGCDEIIWGGAAVDQNGKMLYATGFGHGDAMHMSDLIPDRPGLEVFTVHEEKPYGWNVHDAATGEILHSATGNSDNGRGLSADIDSKNRGFEFWSSNDKNIRSAVTGSVVSSKGVSVNFRSYWDGDLQDEILDGNKMDKWNGNGTIRIKPISGKNFYDIENTSTCNSTKSTPNLSADILGDWREELILHGDDCLTIFTTNVESDFRVPTLMHDHVYRLGVAWQNVAYNQPPHLGYYLPDQFVTKYIDLGGSFDQTVMIGDSIETIRRSWKNCATPKLLKAISPKGTETTTPMEGFSFTRSTKTKTFTLEGKPTLEGTYKFIIESGKNKVDESVRQDTITIESRSGSAIHTPESSNRSNWVELPSTTFADHLTLKLNPKQSDRVSISLFNAAGAKVYHRNVRIASHSELTLNNLHRLTRGTYILSIASAAEEFSQKVIKK